MSIYLKSENYMEYLDRVAKRIAENREYISQLDAATGDGDHWANMNVGFEKLIANRELLSTLNISNCFKRIGLLMMNTIGGSSGILYGGAYMAAGKRLADKEVFDTQDLCTALRAMVDDMCERGKSKPGDKTMIDCLYPAVVAFEEGLASGTPEPELFQLVKAAAQKGAEDTLNMEAVRGRAYYQPNKGVGHLDPGAVTMCYQLEILMDYLMEA